MRKSLLALLLILFWMTWPQPAIAQEASPTPATPSPAPAEGGLTDSLTPVPPGISDPVENASLSGVVSISGSAPAAWDLAFAYANDVTGTWFFLASSTEPVSGAFLPAWDTTVISDGFYLLRLRVFSADAAQEFLVNFRIRNYSDTETPTPAFTPTITPTASATPLPTFTPTVTYTPAPPPTQLPPNPASLNPQAIAVNFGKGALGVTAVFAFFGLLLSISKKLRS